MNTRRILLAALIFCASPAFAKTVSITGVVLDQSGTSAPAVQKLSFAAGETSEIDIAITHPDGTAYNLTGAQVLLAVNGSVISRQATIISAAAGTAKFSLVIADTLGLLGVYAYDITVTATDGSFYRVVPASSFVVTAGIGQPGQAVTVPSSQQPLAQGPPGNPQNIENNGSALTSRSTLNFAGAGITCADNPGAGRTDCTVNSGGTVTSVGLSMPAQFGVSGSPVTGSGTLAVSLANETANTVMCGPSSGPAVAPTFRALVAADLPNTTVTAGSYGDASHSLSATVDAQGRLTSLVANAIAIAESAVTGLVSDLAGKAPTTRLVSAGTGLSGGGDLSADRTLALANTAVTPGSYTNTNLTVDAQGRITAAANGSAGGSTGNWTFSGDGASTASGSQTLGTAPVTVDWNIGSNNINRITSPKTDFQFLNVNTYGIYAASTAVYVDVGGALDYQFDTTGLVPQTTGLTNGSAAHPWQTTYSKRLSPGSQSISFSTTPAFDCTAGNFVHFGTVTANVTGATMVSGIAGEACTIVMLKDATAGAYTVTFAGSNVRTGGLSFNTTASSLVWMRFVWDDRLSTPAWVMTGAGAIN